MILQDNRRRGTCENDASNLMNFVWVMIEAMFGENDGAKHYQSVTMVSETLIATGYSDNNATDKHVVRL